MMDFETFAKELDAAMKDAGRAPDVSCPSCKGTMIRSVGRRGLAGYLCMAMACPMNGRSISVETLGDPDSFNAWQEEGKIRKREFDEMLESNGAHQICQSSSERWCGDCFAYHVPTMEHPVCRLCVFSIHAPMPADIFFNHRGWKFTAPFICMSCGIEVCFRQWAFSRSCGSCDVSNSKTARIPMGRCFVGPHEKLPTWDADKADINETHFVDPKDRDNYAPRVQQRRRRELLYRRSA